MSESPRKTEAMVGLFIFVGLALLGILIVQFGRFGDRFIGKYAVTVVFDDAAGLIRGSEVRMGGAKIGKVATHPALNENVKVEVQVDIDERIRIPEGSAFQISSASILGDKLIVITPPATSTGEFIEAGTTIAGAGPSGLDALQNNAEAVSRDARQLLVDAAKTMKQIDGAIGDIRTATGELTTTLQKVNEGILTEENMGRIETTLANLEQASAGLDPTLADARQAIQSIESAAAEARTTFAEATVRIEELEPALKEIPSAVSSLSRAADKAAETLDHVEGGKGLLGTLAYDEEVSDDAKTFIRNLKQQGILRYRDKETPEDDPRTRFKSRRR
ncbi:MlaD family protein [Haloferula rosea]|uniref:MCE family protein n=1 Tax=Haloferula rosea TaxID=490093 RepID=A0A934VFN1_9BACT|nr:MlaD family protein [Haloferula rosea]MBK1828529.1 MCE family protein [Haloferula rosea]